MREPAAAGTACRGGWTREPAAAGTASEPSAGGGRSVGCGAAAWQAAGEAFKWLHPHHGLPDSVVEHLAEPVGAGAADPERQGARARGSGGSTRERRRSGCETRKRATTLTPPPLLFHGQESWQEGRDPGQDRRDLVVRRSRAAEGVERRKERLQAQMVGRVLPLASALDAVRCQTEEAKEGLSGEKARLGDLRRLLRTKQRCMVNQVAENHRPDANGTLPEEIEELSHARMETEHIYSVLSNLHKFLS